MIYAQLNEENVVIAISHLNGKVIAENLILINDLEIELGSIYDRNKGLFTSPEKQQQTEEFESIEVKLEKIKNLIEKDNITQLDVLATIYEELFMKG